MLVGNINLENFKALDKFSQRAASAWTAFDGEGIVGASYKPILYVGEQVTKGTTYWFLAEQTLMTAEPERHLVKLAINEFNGEYHLVPHSIEILF